MIDYDGRKFRLLSTSDNGEAGSATVFVYHQSGDLVWGEYSGGSIIRGSLLAKCDRYGVLDMYYQHCNDQGELRTGKCISTPVILPDDRIQLHEEWQWTSGDLSSGRSIVEEIPE